MEVVEPRDHRRAGQVRVSGSVFLPSYVESRGGNAASVLEAAGVRAEEIGRADSWLDVERLAAVWECAASHLDDPVFGVRFSQTVPLDSYGVLSYLVLNAPDVRTGAANLARYGRALSFDSVQAGALQVDGPQALVAFRIDLPDVASIRHLLEGHLVGMGKALERLTADPGVPREYHYQHDLSDRARGVAELLGHRVVGGCDHYGVAFDSGLLDLPVVGADRGVLPLLERELSEFTQGGGDDFVARLQNEIGRLLPDGVPPLKQIARRMVMSERSLQRRLHEAGLTYKAVVMDLRMELARSYLDQPNVRISEIATLLGYQEVTSFNHAFRRSTGLSPGAWRNRKASA
jgi:AraC-like DNA-binding protein